ncbi:hypothetical protein B296_00040808, partial [Ensete ventricosum]
CVGVLFNPKLGIPHLEEGQGNLILFFVERISTSPLSTMSWPVHCRAHLDQSFIDTSRPVLCRAHLDQSITDYASTSLIERISSNPLSSISWPVLCQAHLDQSIVDYVLASPCRAYLGQSFVKHISASPLPTTSRYVSTIAISMYSQPSLMPELCLVIGLPFDPHLEPQLHPSQYVAESTMRGGTSPTKQAMEGLIPFLYRAIVSYTDGVRPRSAWYTRLPDESGRLLSSETLYSSSLAATTQPSSAPQSPGAALPEDYGGDRGRRRGLP